MPTLSISKNNDTDDDNNVDYDNIYNDTVYIISGVNSELEHENENDDKEKERENDDKEKERDKEKENDDKDDTNNTVEPVYYQFVSYVKNRVPTRIENLDKIKTILFNTKLLSFTKPSTETETVEFNNHTIVDNLNLNPNPSNSSSIEYVIQNINTAYAYVLDKYDENSLMFFNTPESSNNKPEDMLDCDNNEIIESNNTTPNSVAMEYVIQNINTAYAYVLEKYDDFNEKK